MRFRNLPIEFDSQSKARLKEGADPWGIERAADRRRAEADAGTDAAGGRRVVMRTVGSHAIGVVVRQRGGRR